MGQKIPLGLVTIAQGLSGEISGQETLERPVVKNLWQAFAASRQASQSEVDQRLEYLFWRIWSSEELARRINLQSLNRLVSNILSSNSTKQARPQKIPSLPRAIAPSAAGHSHSKSHPTAGQSLHPILKKPATAPSETQKSARLLLEKPEGGKITCNPSTPPTPDSASPEDHTKDISTTRPTLKKAYPAAMRPIRGNRRRPVFNRRKSSQTPGAKNQSSTPRAMESKATEGLERRYSTTDEESEPLQPEVETGHTHDDNESDIVPFPIELSPPLPQQPSDSMTLTESTLVTDLTNLDIKPSVTVTPAFPPISENEDPMLSQEIETVSQDPMPQDKGKQRAETINSSSESEDLDQILEETDVPGFPGAKRVPMPKKMKKRLLGLLGEARLTTDAKKKIPLPSGPSISSDRTWLPLYPQPYLEDWMLQDEATSSTPQPSNKPLVAPGFRKRFAKQLEEEMKIWRKEEEARKELEDLAVTDSEVV